MRIWLTISLLVMVVFLSAQNDLYKGCGAENYYSHLRPHIADSLGIMDRHEKSYRGRAFQYYKTRPSILTIPVVVHVIHNNGSENLSDIAIENTLSAFNELLLNASNFNYTDNVSLDIQLCLGQRDDQNNASGGINRVQSTRTDVHMTQTDGLMKRESYWSTRDFLNIWIVREISGDNINPAGYATMPWFHGLGMDGIVIEARYFNARAENIQVLAHEFGHYLGLHHTFTGGCGNNDCLMDGDRVCDTPPDNSRQATPCGVALNSCSSDSDDSSINNPFRSVSLGGTGDQPDQVENHMDYGYSSCQYKFTQGQKERMRYFLEEVRTSLLLSKGCLEPCPNNLVADFLPNDTIIQAGVDIDFINTSQNATAFRWLINGREVDNQRDLNYNFQEEGEYEITLWVFSNDERCDSIAINYEIEVFCPVQAGAIVDMSNDTLRVENDSDNEISHHVNIYDNQNTLLHQSTNDFIEYRVETGWYKICVSARGETCSDSTCTYIQYFGENEENCGNQQDDDGDGLVDAFDPDCPCENDLYHAVCPVNCEYIPDSNEIKIKLKWQSSRLSRQRFEANFPFLAGDVDGDGRVEIVCQKRNTYYPNRPWWVDQFWILDGETGRFLQDITAIDSIAPNRSVNNFGIADLDRDGFSEVFFHGDSLFCMDVQGNLKYRSERIINHSFIYVNAADFNLDGLPELYTGRGIINGLTGNQIAYGREGAGLNRDKSDPLKIRSISIAADVLPHPGLELVAGNTVYEVELNNLNDTLGNRMIPVFPNDFNMLDGFSGIGDFDGDSNLDVVVINGEDRNNPGSSTVGDTLFGIWIWDPRTGNTLAYSDYLGKRGGIPSVGDVNGDCIPEIGVVFENELCVFNYDGTQDLKLLYKIQVEDISGFGGMTMFDLNGDGINEIVHRDERYLRIIDGPTGIVIDSMAVRSVTGYEYPLIVDIDNDNEAEILISGSIDRDNEAYLFAFESAGSPWASARPVWNQFGYHSTNINDDLTVPRVQQNMAKPLEGYEDCLRETCPTPYNGFLMQSTYRTQAGCVQFPAVDFSVNILGYDCNPDSITLHVEVCNNSDGKSVPKEWCMGAYSALVGNATITKHECYAIPIDTLHCVDTITMRIPTPRELAQLYVVVNDDGTGALPIKFPITNVVECDYSNNIDSILLDIQWHDLDIGADITKCESEVITLQAPPGFSSYLWSDLTSDTIYSSAEEGIHWLEVTDQCGRTYRDSMEISYDHSNAFLLGTDIEDCAGQEYLVEVAENYDNIWWLPSEAVGCDTCFSTKAVIQDTLTLLIAVTQKGACTYVDTIALIPTIGERFAINDSICGGDSLLFYGEYYHDEGEYFYSSPDCDSTIILSLSLRQNSTGQKDESICEGDSLLWDSRWLTEGGEYTRIVPVSNRCDSVITLSLEVKKDTFSRIESWLCAGDSIQWGAEWLHESGLYSRTLMAVNGCDSISYLQLDIANTDTTEIAKTFCRGDSVIHGRQVYDQEGIYWQTYSSTTSCDSVIRLEIVEIPPEKTEVEYQICIGDSLYYEGVWYDEEGSYEVELLSQLNCDSLVDLRIIEVDTLQEEATYRLCPNTSIEIADSTIRSSGTYTFYVESVAGCDSVFYAEVQVLDIPEEPELVINCESGRAQVSVPTNQLWGVVWSNGDTSFMTNYDRQASIVATRTTDNGCVIVQELEIPSLPNINILPQLHDTSVMTLESLSFTVDLDESEWMISWSPESSVSCSTCFDVEIDPRNGLVVEVEMIHSSGCSYRESFIINVILEEADLFIPNAFSPNDDNNNDIWQIYLPEEIEQLDRVMIFDRWGSQLAVWENTDDVRWDGMYKGEALNPAVFAYFVEYRTMDGERHIKTGDITLMR